MTSIEIHHLIAALIFGHIQRGIRRL
ncbi:MAG: hypothetical protein RLZZ186_203, partial [Cyanobacteriota bacterium]